MDAGALPSAPPPARRSRRRSALAERLETTVLPVAAHCASIVNCAVGDPVAGSPAATLSTPTVQPFALLRSKNTLASMPVSKKPPEITTVPGGQLTVPEPTPPGTTVKGADVTVWMFVATTPLNFASACFDLRSAFFAVFKARLASFTGLAELKAPGPPAAGTADDKTKTTTRAATESVKNLRTFLPFLVIATPTTAQGEQLVDAGEDGPRPKRMRSTVSGKTSR